MPPYRRDEYATSTSRVRDLRRQKDALYGKGMPREACAEMVRTSIRPDAYSHLGGKDNCFLVAPSTTGRNPLPYLLAKRLQQEHGGQVVTGWALPLETKKASAKGGIGKMENPARFAAVDSKLSQIPRRANLVDDVVTTGETTDALREVLALRGMKADAVVSLGQSEMRKVSPRDIERITEKLGEPSVRAQVEGVLQGRLKHKANYIERAIHDDTRARIRNYFETEHRRLQGLGAVQSGGDRSLRNGDPSHRRFQFPWRPEAGHSRGGSGQSPARPGHAAIGGSRESGFLTKVQSLESLRSEVRRGDVSKATANRKALRILQSRQMRKADAKETIREASQFLFGNPRRTAQELVLQAQARLDRVRTSQRLGVPPVKQGEIVRELNRLRQEVIKGADIQTAAGRALHLLGGDSFSRADRMRTALEVGAFLKNEDTAPEARQIVRRSAGRELEAKRQLTVGKANAASRGRN